MPSFYDSTQTTQKGSKKVKGYNAGGITSALKKDVSMAVGMKDGGKTAIRGCGAARTQYFGKNG